MKICTLIVASALSLSAALASSSHFRGALFHLPRRLASTSTFPSDLNTLPTSDAYHMEPVHVVHARLESDVPEWDRERGLFVSKNGGSFDDKFRGPMDTVNTVSVEGALMYLQAEGINYATRGMDESTWCTRTNDVKYVVLYEVVVAQTNETLAQTTGSEFGPLLVLNDGQCASSECLQLNGEGGEPRVGPWVGGARAPADRRAPYPDAWAFSFPNSCPLEPWANKTDECRAAEPGGLCPYDTKPDGVRCTYNYRVLGWVPIDDLVGITALNGSSDEQYVDFNSFCEDGGVEFNATADGEWISGLDFWRDPQDHSANAARAAKLVEVYNGAVSGDITLTQVDAADLAHFKALPTIADLTSENPPCYKNVKACAKTENGCRRQLYGQICVPCASPSSECIVAPEGFTFPTLQVASVASPTDSPTPTPEPTTPEPTTPEPSATAPEPTSEPTTPEPTTAAPDPTPEPTTAVPEPTPESTTATPEPTATVPGATNGTAPVSTTPSPTNSTTTNTTSPTNTTIISAPAEVTPVPTVTTPATTTPAANTSTQTTPSPSSGGSTAIVNAVSLAVPIVVTIVLAATQ